jgi:hypothetical protein
VRDEQITKLQTEVTEYRKAADDMAAAHKVERDALSAKLTALEQQEPVAWRFVDDEDRGHVSYSTTPPTNAQIAYLATWERPTWQPLYAAGAAPQPAKDVNAELVAALLEASAFIHAVNTGEKPEVRYPLSDELDGFAAILSKAAPQPVEAKPAMPFVPWSKEAEMRESWTAPQDGWKLVPIEPTHEQAKAAADAWLDCGSKLILNKAQAAVRAGIAAAQGEQQ